MIKAYDPLQGKLTLEELRTYQKPVPRYTSYPPVPSWKSLDPAAYELQLSSRKTDEPVSIYIHVPFCRTMCLFCACHVILNRREDQRRAYADLVLKEMELVFSKIGKVPLKQLHLGGGTPTYMPMDCLASWLVSLKSWTLVDPEAEISIEIDPRTVADAGKVMLRELRQMGFNRVSFGVQDTDARVQEAIRRRQTASVSEQTFQWAKEEGFTGINIDLIYGLPLQTLDSFTCTAQQIASWRPSRIALFSFALVPWLKGHQRAIAQEELPSDEEKLRLYLIAREIFLKEGYIAIGMDHFALAEDQLAQDYLAGKLQRNFQGYSRHLAEDLIGLGVSSTGLVGDLYVQNVKEIDAYEEQLAKGQLASFRGLRLNEDDKRRKWVIQAIMCRFHLSFSHYTDVFGTSFIQDFAHELRLCQSWQKQGMMFITDREIEVTAKGRVFVRLLASSFDAYLRHDELKPRFSMSI